jgi:hypothetical protein
VRRATWVWTRPDPTELVTWAQGHHVVELFVDVGADVASDGDLDWLRPVVQQAHAAGVRVSALGGDAAWIDRPRDGVAWTNAVLSVGLFDGVHVDVEPWSRDDWPDRQRELVEDYLQLLREVAGVCPVPLEADVPFWLHEVTTSRGTPVDAAVMGIVDAVTVLSYRNVATGEDSITAVGAAGLVTAGRVGIPCRLAVETNDLGPEPVQRKQTFHGLGSRALDAALESVDEVQSGVAAYAGVAVHDYEGWRAL